MNFFNWTPDGGSGRNFVRKFCNGPWLGESEGFLVRKRESEALMGADGDMVGWFKRGYHPVKRIGPSLM